MASDRPIRALQTLAGVAGILVGVFVLTFAFVGGNAGVSFASEFYGGGSLDPWIEAVLAAPAIWRLAVLALSIGFVSMFVSAFALFQLLDDGLWPKYLSLAGYLTGIPMVLNTFLSHYGLMLQIERTGSPLPPALLAHAEVASQEWLVAAALFGPLLVVVLGTGLLAWCLKKQVLIPAWLGYWGMACAAMALLYHLEAWVPAFGVFSLGAGPLHMLWFLVMGVVVLRGR